MISPQEKHQQIGIAVTEYSKAKVDLAFIENRISLFRKVCRDIAENGINHLNDHDIQWLLASEQIKQIVKERNNAITELQNKQVTLSLLGVSL